ncbi:Potassium Voltage-Gated Channel Subfamily F Member 1 [Manis pentadactyla]|nr:Potassium Voltage-Gated Channel Subfamily F Member 1 [Manis pentadactyla]
MNRLCLELASFHMLAPVVAGTASHRNLNHKTTWMMGRPPSTCCNSHRYSEASFWILHLSSSVLCATTSQKAQTPHGSSQWQESPPVFHKHEGRSFQSYTSEKVTGMLASPHQRLLCDCCTVAFVTWTKNQYSARKILSFQ